MLTRLLKPLCSEVTRAKVSDVPTKKGEPLRTQKGDWARRDLRLRDRRFVQLGYGDADAFQRVLCLLIAMGEMVGDDFGVGFR